MASLYKKPVVITHPKTGQRVKTKSKKWWGRFKDENGFEKRVPLATDRAAAQTMLAEHVRKVERKLAGLEDPHGKHHKRPLSEHVNDFEKFLKHKGTSAGHVQKTTQRIKSVISGCKFNSILQISPSRVQEYLADLRGCGGENRCQANCRRPIPGRPSRILHGHFPPFRHSSTGWKAPP